MSENFRRYAIAVGSVVAGVAVRWALGGMLAGAVPYITLYPAVVFAIWFGGFGPGLVAGALSIAYVATILRDFHTPGDFVRAAIFVVFTISFAWLNERLQTSRASANRDRDLLQVTLASIGDAMIATDAEGRVTFLNEVATGLTGWTQAEAAGRPVAEVFEIRNELTGVKTVSPVEKVLREGKVVLLANHTVVRHRDGHDIPIEDSAAPIRGREGKVLGVVLVFRDVTERRRAEGALKRSEERLTLALEAGQIGTWDWDVATNKCAWSERVYEIHGVSQGTFGGRVEDFAAMVHPEDRERMTAAIQGALRPEGRYQAEYRAIRPDGEIRWIAATGRTSCDEGGAPARMLGTVTDVTDRKTAEAQLLEQWHMFDTALSNTPDFNYVFDLEGRFRYVNRARLEMFQMTLEEVLGKTYFDLPLYPRELAQRFHDQIQAVIRTKEPERGQSPFTGANGVTRHYEYIFVPVLSEAGTVQAVVGTTHDITELKLVEERLRASQDRLQAIYDSTYEYMGLLSAGGLLLDCNPALLRFAGNTRDEVLGKPFWETPWFTATPGMLEVVKRAVAQVATGQSIRTEMTLIRPNGEARTFDFSIHPIFNERGEVSLMVPEGRDTTDLKRVEEELRKSNTELSRVNRELEEFAYVASHDLQEPLRMVNIYTELILNDLDQGTEVVGRHAEVVQQGVRRMEGLIHDLLTFSRAVHSDGLPVGTADLNAALGDALVVLKSRIEESGASVTADALPVVQADVTQMSHVFQNLLSNAVKYKGSDAPRIHIGVREDVGGWTIYVRDNGIGFEPQYSERIFGLFKRLYKEEYPGSGLGLAICKRIVERYGGRIWAEGRPGEGATFYFSLPKAE